MSELTLNETEIVDPWLLLQEKDQQLRAVAHDLRNPLGGISSLATLLIQDNGLSHEQTEIIGAIKSAASYTLELVDGLLSAKKQSALPDITREIDMHSVISDYLRYAQPLLNQKGQQVALDLLDSEAFLKVDREKLTRVIDNLIGNAIKFTPCGGEITITTQFISDGLQITVKDNGVGIPETMQQHIFSGQGGGRCGTSGERSHGLGLPICKKIIEDYRGTLHFLSRAGKGTIFYVWLPNVNLKNRQSA